MDTHRVAPNAPPKSEVIRAAADLLLDPNPKVHRICEDQLLAWGPASRPSLEALCECDDEDARARVRRVLRAINTRAWTAEFREFATAAAPDLEDGLLLLSRLPRPLLDPAFVSEQLDEWAASLRPRVAGLGSRKLVATLRAFLYEELGLRGERRSYYDPDNTFLDQVVQRRCGIPISLCAVYLLVGRRIGLPLEGVGLPGHFILRLRSARSVLFDPFHDGRIVTRRDCIERLDVMGYAFQESLLEPVSDRRMLIRALGNLLHTFGFGEDRLYVAAVQDARKALASRG